MVNICFQIYSFYNIYTQSSNIRSKITLCDNKSDNIRLKVFKFHFSKISLQYNKYLESTYLIRYAENFVKVNIFTLK